MTRTIFALSLILFTAGSVRAETNTDAMAAYINAMLAPRATGYSFTIVEDGQVAVSTAAGVKRAGQGFKPNTKIHVASVSKTVTAVAVLQLLEANNLDVYDYVGPWLPDDWSRGFGFWNNSGVRFIDLLSHTSGIQQTIGKYLTTIPNYGDVSINSYDGLKTLVANGIAADWKNTGCAQAQNDGTYVAGAAANPGSNFGVYCYKNANYGLFRILIPRLWQDVAPEVAHNELTDELTAWMYMAYVAQHIWGPLGFNAACYDSDVANRTHYYDARYPTAAPKEDWGDDSMAYGCGPVGWHLSSFELAKFTTYLSHPEWVPAEDRILSIANRDLMDSLKLGWSAGANSGAETGIFWHGGDYMSSTTALTMNFGPTGPPWIPVGASRESHACIMKFDDDVEVAAVINSNLRGAGIWHPALFNQSLCRILINAHEAGRVPTRTRPIEGGGLSGGSRTPGITLAQ